MKEWTQPAGFAGSPPRLRIDLNMLRGDKIRARKDFGTDTAFVKVGDAVLAEDEDRGTWLAAVEEVDGVRVKLRLDLDSLIPGTEFRSTSFS